MRHMEYMKMMEEKHKPKRRVIGTMTAKVHSKADLNEVENQKTVDMVQSP